MHLKGPWEFEWVSGPAEKAGSTGRVTMPADWRSMFGDASGTVRFRRRFHRPTNLEEHERVFIVFDGLGGTASVAVNGQQLGTVHSPQHSAEFEITRRLEPSNILTVEVEFDAAVRRDDRGGLWGPVALEVRCG